MLSKIHVRPSAVRENVKNGCDEPCILVRQNERERLAHEIEIVDASGAVVARISPQFKNPSQSGLGKGACVWVETELQVRLIGESWPIDPALAPVEFDDATSVI